MRCDAMRCDATGAQNTKTKTKEADWGLSLLIHYHKREWALIVSLWATD